MSNFENFLVGIPDAMRWGFSPHLPESSTLMRLIIVQRLTVSTQQRSVDESESAARLMSEPLTDYIRYAGRRKISPARLQ